MSDTPSTPFTIAKSKKRKRDSSASSSTQPPKPRRHKSGQSNSENLANDSITKSKPVKRNKKSHDQLKQIIRDIDVKYGKYCVKSGGKSVKIWKPTGDKKSRMKCLVCEQYPDIAHSGMSGNNTCAMALANGQIYNLDRLLTHYKGSKYNKSHENVVNHIKYLLELKTINDELMGSMDDQKETNLSIRNCFNIILDNKKKKLY